MRLSRGSPTGLLQSLTPQRISGPFFLRKPRSGWLTFGSAFVRAIGVGTFLSGLVLSGLFLPNVVDAAELVVPEPFDVLSVNGKEFGNRLQSIKRLPLQVGRNVVVLEYDQIFDARFGDSHDRIQSAPFTLVFDADENATLTLADPGLTDADNARAYAKQPALQLRDQQQREVVHVLQADNVGTVTLAPTVASAAAEPAAPASTAKPAPALPLPAMTAPVPDTKAAAMPATPDALKMLSYWWQQASPEQRAAFLQQIVR